MPVGSSAFSSAFDVRGGTPPLDSMPDIATEIAADSPRLWMDCTDGSLVMQAGPAPTVRGAPAANAASYRPGQQAVQFNTSADDAAWDLDLSDTDGITVELLGLMIRGVGTLDGRPFMHHAGGSTKTWTMTGEGNVAGGNTLQVQILGTTTSYKNFPRPTNAWSHMVFQYDRSVGGSAAIARYSRNGLDTASFTNNSGTGHAGNFGSGPLYFNSGGTPNAVVGFRVAHLAIYPTLLTTGRILEHARRARL